MISGMAYTKGPTELVKSIKAVAEFQKRFDYLCYVSTLTEKMDTTIRNTNTMDSKCAVLVELVCCAMNINF